MALGEDNATAGPPEVARYHLLVIGVEYYTNYARLHNTVTDAAKVAGALIGRYSFDRPGTVADLRMTDRRYDRPEYPNPIPLYQSAGTTCLFNENASRDNILDKLDEYASSGGDTGLGEDDALVIYFAGHGIFKDPFYYLVLHNSDISKPRTMISVDEIALPLKNYAVQKKGRHILLILDSCFAGGASFGFTTSQTGKNRFSRQILTSCSAEQPADDGLLYAGSAFANALCNALKENQEPTINIEKLKILQEAKFAADETKTSDVQRIETGAMPGALG
ncbi:MAG: caspase family protein, partial [Chitinophagaceae bacterium]